MYTYGVRRPKTEQVVVATEFEAEEADEPADEAEDEAEHSDDE